MNKIAFFCAPALVAVSFAATSSHATDFYAGVSAIGSSYNDADVYTDFAAGGTTQRKVDLDNGFGAQVRAGAKFDSFRAELEVGYRETSVDSVSGGSTLTNVSGDADLYTAMLNGAYDFTGNDLPVTPYVAAGFGAAAVKGDVSYTDTDGDANTDEFAEWTVAGQVGLGASYALSSEVDLIGGYSLLAAPTDKLGTDQYLTIHNLQVGINYNF